MSTGLSEGCAKKALTEKTEEIIQRFTEDFNSGKLTKAKAPKVNKNFISEDVMKTSVDSDVRNCKFVDFLSEWLITAKPTLAITSYTGYRHTADRVIKYFKDKYPEVLLDDVSALMIQQFYNDLYSNGLKANTVKHYHALLHRAFKYAVKMDMLGSNPTDKTELPKITKYSATF